MQSHLPLSISLNGRTYYTSMQYANRLKTDKQIVLRELINVPYKNFIKEYDIYRGHNVTVKDELGNPKILSSKVVTVWGYYLAKRPKSIQKVL